jgi:tripartite-type tricarboxylate transporter receptor subunit TctC
MRLVLGLAPGGGTDALARTLAQGLSARSGRQVIVDNRAGAGGNLAPVAVLSAPANGCTLLVTGNWHNTNLFAFAKPGYEARDFAPVGLVGEASTLLVANAQQPFKTVDELVRHATANPGALSYGSAGIGSANHLTMERFLRAADIRIVHVPYKGAAPAVADVLSGVVALTVSGATATLPHITSGRLRALAVTGPQRMAALPDVPTLAEAGYAKATSVVWTGVLAPAATPLALREKLNAEIRALLADRAFADALRGYGFAPAGNSVDEFAAFLAEDLRATQGIIRELQIKPE